MRRVALVALVSVVLLAVAGCSPEEAESSPDIVESRGAVGVPVEVADGGEVGIAQPDGRALLSSALAMYDDGYQFAAVAEVQGLEAAAVNGVVIGQSAQMTVLSGDATISYVTTRDGSWIQTEGGKWQVVGTAGPIERPLDHLASPTSITILSSDNDGTSAVAVYDGAAFDSDDVIEMSLHFVDGRLVSASYETGRASVSTSFSPLDGASIEAPTPST